MTALGNIVRRNFEPLVLSVQVILDLVVIILACVAGFYLRRDFVDLPMGPDNEAAYLVNYQELFSIVASVCLLWFHYFGMYSPIKSLLNVEEYKAVAKSTFAAFLSVPALVMFLHGTTTTITSEGSRFAELVFSLHRAIDLDQSQQNNSRLVLVFAFGFILVFTILSRFISFKFIQGLHRKGIGNRNVVVIGDGSTGQSLQRKFLLVPTLGLNFVGFVGADRQKVGTMIERSRVLGTTDQLEYLLGLYKVSEVFVALPEAEESEVMTIVHELERLGVNYHVVPRFYHLMTYKVRIENLDSVPLISRPVRQESPVGAIVKRCLDLAVASSVLVLSSVFFLISAILIRRESKGPIFFRQTRIGLDGKAFEMLKFRTMHHVGARDAVAPANEYDPRVTRVGRFLRRYSLDELPNFLNVLRGEMSVVGPRPEMPFIVETYTAQDRERLRAKPGVTGLWQISYARTQSIHENLDYDLYYIENQSFLLDLVIIALTGFAVAKGTGAY